MDFLAGLSPEGTWDGVGTCASLYCHGNGNGTNCSYSHDLQAPSCGGCHPYPGTENIAYARMSGQHARHVGGQGLQCSECHDASGVLLHVDGKPDVEIAAAGFDFDPATRRCTGTCHSRVHSNELW